MLKELDTSFGMAVKTNLEDMPVILVGDQRDNYFRRPVVDELIVVSVAHRSSPPMEHAYTGEEKFFKVKKFDKCSRDIELEPYEGHIESSYRLPPGWHHPVIHDGKEHQ